MPSTFTVKRALITGQNPAHPGIAMVAPAGATKDAIFSLTPIFWVKFLTFGAIAPTDDWVVNPMAWVEKFFLKNVKGLSFANIDIRAPVVIYEWIMDAT